MPGRRRTRVRPPPEIRVNKRCVDLRQVKQQSPLQIVLAAARGRASTRIAADLGISEDTARKWRGRFAQQGLMVHTPVHASWLNQIEIFFSVIQKKVVSPNDFASLEELQRTLLAFIDRYNQTARPFNWKFTADDLTDLLARISGRQQADLVQAA